MSNKQIRLLTKEAISQFEKAFSNTTDLFTDGISKKIIQPPEMGSYRENITKNLLLKYIPSKFEIGTGFVVTNKGDVSTQCDIIIYDPANTPLIEDISHRRFFPVETVVGIGEVKSNIQSKSELNKILKKLAKIKMLREKTLYPMTKFQYMPHLQYQPEANPYDQLFSFLICNKFDFTPDEESINYEAEILNRFRHNLILSVENGTFSYKTVEQSTKNLTIPNAGLINHMNHWLPKDNSDISKHMIVFLSGVFSGIKNTTILDPDMAVYLTDDITSNVSH